MFYSQFGQDQVLETYVFKQFKNGTFVDVGAHDGLSINNTLYFEQMHGWKGINIEANPDVYQQLVLNRPSSINMNVAITDRNDGTAGFLKNSGYTEMISGLVDHYEPEHRERLEKELREHGGSSTIIQVPCRRLDSIFEEHSIHRVHLLSVDVEGAEMAVLQSIDFDRVFIDVIVVEDNYKTRHAQSYLETKGYIKICERHDDILIHQHSDFLQNLRLLP